jgi:mannosyl-3-phosphoglycerate phosphatase
MLLFKNYSDVFKRGRIKLIIIIFTDLDGTLLDTNNYSFQKGKNALNLIKKRKVPLIFCTSKTRAEIEFWREKMGNVDPFISENGGGIFIPKNYFSFEFLYDIKHKNYFVIKLGTEYNKLVEILDLLKEKYEIISFSDMSIEEVAKDANLEPLQAKLAKKREFDLPFKILNKKQEKDIRNEIKKHGLNYTVGGRYYHLLGNNNKGEAVKILSDLFRCKYSDIKTIAIGDSENDFQMLDAVNEGFLVKKKDGSYASNKYKKAKGVGPKGWNDVILREILS